MQNVFLGSQRLEKKMKRKSQKLVFLFLSFIMNTLLFSSQERLQPEFYQLNDSGQVNNIQFFITKNKRQRNGGVKNVQVYDDFACLQQCLRLPSDCIAVNFMKQAVMNGFHICELLSFESRPWDNSAFEDNSDFDFIVVKVSTSFFKEYIFGFSEYWFQFCTRTVSSNSPRGLWWVGRVVMKIVVTK